jgi:hypothetical protein
LKFNAQFHLNSFFFTFPTCCVRRRRNFNTKKWKSLYRKLARSKDKDAAHKELVQKRNDWSAYQSKLIFDAIKTDTTAGEACGGTLTQQSGNVDLTVSSAQGAK